MSEKPPKAPVFSINNNEYENAFENVVRVTDRNGHSIPYNLFEGVHYALPFSTSNLMQVRGFKMRPEDIYFTAYPRTGSNWTYERIVMLVNGKAETIPNFKEHIDLLPASHFDSKPSPRVISSHMMMSQSPEELLTKKCKVVYSMRDPKDVIVSLYNFRYGRQFPGGQYCGSFDDFLQLFLKGKVDHNSLFEHCHDAERYFEDHPEMPVYIHIYEESQKDPVKAVQELSDFLGLPRDDSLCKAIAVKCEFSKMKVDKQDYTAKLDGEDFLYRKGTSGDWRNWFTGEMLDDYYKVYEEKMAGSRFYDRYSRSATS